MSTRDPLSVRPTRYTDDAGTWRTVLAALGAVAIVDEGDQALFQLGAGRLALCPATESTPAGSTALGMETSVPLAEAVSAAAAEGVAIELRETEHGPAGVVVATDGTTFTLAEAAASGAEAPEVESPLAVMPVWRTTDARAALDVLDGLGLRRRVTLDDGTWADLTARSGGLHGVRPLSDGVGTELAFELAGDVDDLRAALLSAGVGAQVSDGGNGRVLLVDDPDGGEPLRVIERRPDLYTWALSEM